MIKTKSRAIGIAAFGILSVFIIGATPLVLQLNAQKSE
jgi:hypothetical protein